MFCIRVLYLMQPTRLVNPGLAAYKPSRTVIAYAPPLKLEREALTPVARAEPEPETVGASAPQVPEPKKAEPQGKTRSASRARPVRGTQPSYPTNYAYQPFSGDYRPMY
jgi:hypothetical protein